MFNNSYKSFLFYGIFYPNKLIQALILSVIWELVKLYMDEGKTLDEIKEMITNYDINSEVIVNIIAEFSLYYLGSMVRGLIPI